ncbi:MAG: hypothetical protein ACREBN_09300, partial [Burkholderiaceae bacterium]
MKKIPAAGLVGEAALREAVDYRQVIDAVRRAIEAARSAASYSPTYVSIVALFADRAVVECGAKFLAYPYTIDDAYTVTLEQPTAVVMDWKAVKMKEAGQESAFSEASPESAASGKFDVVVIRAGTSLNGNYYGDAALKEAVPMFANVRVFVKSDAEHVAGGGKDFNKLIGELVAPRFVEGAGVDGGRILARLELINPEDAIGVKLREAFARGKQHLFGLSIDAVGKTATVLREGKKVRVATKFTKVNSVDLIVEPGAGGGLVRMVEADDSNAGDPDPSATETKEHDDMTLKQRMLEAIKAKDAAKAAKINLDTVSDEELETAYREALAIEPAPKVKPNPDDKPTGLTEAQVEERISIANARSYARSKLVESKLPAKTKERLQKQFDGLASLTEAVVDAALKEAREEIGSFIESGRVSMPDIEVEDRSKKVADMFDAFFDPARKEHRSIHSFKECYIEMTGDKTVSGQFRDCDPRKLRESFGDFREAIDSTTFADALGDSITRRMQAVFVGKTDLQAWRKVATVTSVSDFRSQERARIGGYGNLPAVAQGADYVALTSPGDDKATYTVSKRGGLETLTREMIKNDDVGAVRRIPVELALAAANTLYEFVFDFFRTNPTVYDSVALYHATHANLAAAALDATSFAAHRLLMAKQPRAGSTKRLGLAPRTILVPWELEETAFNLFVRNTNIDKTFVNTINPEVIVPAYWTDANDWVTVADPQDLPVLEIGFMDGKETPELFVQDMPNVGSMFAADKLTYKIRHEYSGAVL